MPENMSEVMFMARRGGSCSCNIPKMVAGVLAIALGIYLVVFGYNVQGPGRFWPAILWYFLGVFAICLGKHLKCRAMECPVH